MSFVNAKTYKMHNMLQDEEMLSHCFADGNCTACAAPLKVSSHLICSDKTSNSSDNDS